MTISAVPESASSLIAIESLKNEHNTAANLGYANSPARKPYHTELLCSLKNSDFGTISVTERRDTVPISEVQSHIRGTQRQFSEEYLFGRRFEI